MERYCSFVGASVKSRRFPYVNISRRIRDVAMLRIIRERYDLHDSVKFGKTKATQDEDEEGEYIEDCESTLTTINVFTQAARQMTLFCC
jgi:hypothetical protein